MYWIIEYKWWILLCLEILAWSSTFFMFYARYGLKSNRWFNVGVALTLITGVFPQVTMGIFNYILTRHIDVYTTVIALLLIYGLTIGKGHVKRLDLWMQKRFS